MLSRLCKPRDSRRGAGWMARMKSMLSNELVIREEHCNLSCQYCLTGQSNFKEGHLNQLIFKPPKLSEYSSTTDLGTRIDAVIASSSASGLSLPIIKITGGEIFLVHGIMDLLRRLAEEFATLVIQTNGTLLDKRKLTEIGSWKNVCLQVSLDSVSYDGNAYRSATVGQHEKIRTKIYGILDAGIPSEIYCVLTDRSLPEFEHTLRAFERYSAHVVVHPFPVRGPDRDKFYPKPEQISVLHNIASRYDEYSKILPPKAYFARLLRFFDERERTFRCHLPRFAFTTFDDGYLTACPNIWFNKVGNLLTEEPHAVMGRLEENPFRQLLLSDHPRIDACKHCFTPWDMLSMFMDREITLAELARTPMYAASRTQARIQEIANVYWGTKC